MCDCSLQISSDLLPASRENKRPRTCPRRANDEVTSGGADRGAAALRGRNLPVIVAEIRVQRVQIETHSHGGAQQLRNHLSKPKWGRK